MTQEKAIELALKGHNIFLTGKAGTGKSYTLNKIVEALKKKGRNVAITASTGIAATHIGGNTIHSWAGIGIKDQLEAEDLFKLKNNKFSNERISQAEVLIIDEISMLHDYRLDMVDEVLRFIKNSHSPFGGIQILLVGDFYQLPPVEKNGKNNYTFNAKVWDAAEFKVCYLEKIYRQENDVEFMNILNSIRDNSITPEQKEILNKLKDNTRYKEQAINLYSKNIDVEKENNFKLDSIEGEKHTFSAEIYGEPFHVQRILKNWLGREFLHLKIGAKVMFIVNDHREGYYNGTMGTVIDFHEESGYPIVKLFKSGRKITVQKNEWSIKEEDESGKEIKLASVLQFPLRLAYAITIHKCVTGDTLILTKKGIETIKDLVGNDVNANWSVNKKIKISDRFGKYKETDEVFNGGEKNIFKFTTDSGFSIKSSHEHPLLVMNKNGEEKWIESSKIRNGDILILTKNQKVGSINCLKVFHKNTRNNGKEYRLPNFLDIELAWTLGIIIGDGCITDKRDGRVDITNPEREIIERFSKNIESIFKVKTTTKYIDSKHCFLCYFHSRGVRDFLKNIGLDYVKSIEKNTPKVIFTSTPEMQSSYIQGLFDTDGGVNSCIHFTTASERLINETQVILLNLGIFSSKRILKFGWRLQILGENGRDFVREIGFFSPTKKEKSLLKFRINNLFSPKMQKNFFPNSVELAKKIRCDLEKEFGLKTNSLYSFNNVDRKIGEMLYRFITEKAKMSPNHIKFFIENIPDFFNKKEYSDYSKFKNYIFEEVVKIEEGCEYVYDVHIPDGHEFVGNGFVNHNSQGCTFDYVNLDMSDVFLLNMGYVALSRITSLEGLWLKAYNFVSLHTDVAVIQKDKEFLRKSRESE